jgi:hypothetical protein
VIAQGKVISDVELNLKEEFSRMGQRASQDKKRRWIIYNKELTFRKKED